MEYWINIFENKSLVSSLAEDPHTQLDEAIDHVSDYSRQTSMIDKKYTTPWTYRHTIHHKDGKVEIMDLLPLLDELNHNRSFDRAHNRAVTIGLRTVQ